MLAVLALTSHLITGLAPNETYTVFLDEVPQLEVEVSEVGNVSFDMQTDGEVRLGTLPTPSHDEGAVSAPPPARFSLVAAPSPTSGPLNVLVSIPEGGSGLTRVDLFDAGGRHMGEVSTVFTAPGTHRLAWDTAFLESGLYFVRARRGHEERVTRFLVVR